MNEQVRFRDREEAGRLLAAELAEYAGRGDVLVLALPRGGVPVGYEVAQGLGAPPDASAPMASSSCPGTPSFRTTKTSSGAPRALATS